MAMLKIGSIQSTGDEFMPRMARLVVPGYPHHVMQRGNRRQRTFFEEADYLAYIGLISELKGKVGVDVWAYCLMPNHVHFIVVPRHKQSLAKLFGIAHHRYARRVNSVNGWVGHLWQERFHSFVMDEPHLLAAVRYVALNPVRAGLCVRPEDWRWSSANAHLHCAPDKLVDTAAMRERVSDWRHFLSKDESPDLLEVLRRHTRSGRPAGDKRFIEKLEGLTGRRLQRRRSGPRSRS
jgi:putative transposase